MSANVQGFGCRPMEMVQLAPGPASESRQRTNPQVMCAESAALNYGDFAAGSGLLRWIEVIAAIGLRATLIAGVGVYERFSGNATGLVA